MRKLTLKIEALEVETFETATADASPRGTVRGAALPPTFPEETDRPCFGTLHITGGCCEITFAQSCIETDCCVLTAAETCWC